MINGCRPLLTSLMAWVQSLKPRRELTLGVVLWPPHVDMSHNHQVPKQIIFFKKRIPSPISYLNLVGVKAGVRIWTMYTSETCPYSLIPETAVSPGELTSFPSVCPLCWTSRHHTHSLVVNKWIWMLASEPSFLCCLTSHEWPSVHFPDFLMIALTVFMEMLGREDEWEQNGSVGSHSTLYPQL